LDSRRDRRFAGFVAHQACRIALPLHSTQILSDVAVSKDALPNNSAHAAGCRKSFCLLKQAQVSRVSFQAQYQAFVRFAVGSSAAL
jgi:hypothetical protein